MRRSLFGAHGGSGRRMYSLYRSWLSRDQPPPPLPLPLPIPRDPLSLPDVVVAVGEGPTAHQFAAHRAVLSANSGYFKAALAPCTTCVSVSGVAADAFAPLLAFMYTGYLDLTRDNIYGVLLATHYLHMPRALELCWGFLRTHQPQPHTLVKPIPIALPGRGKPAPWRPASPPAGPPAAMVLPTAEHSPFRSLQPYPPPPSAAAAVSETPPDPESEPRRHQDTAPEVTAASAAETSPEIPPAPPQSEPHNQSPRPQPEVRQPTKSPSKPVVAVAGAGGKVVIDVACCDGPVRFHRVLNSSYGSLEDGIVDPPDENQLHQGMHVPGAAQLRRARLDKAQAAEGEYTCLYCNHTFKSHYCYQKHARRHLNPLTHRQAEAAASQPQRAPARPLDMNVQYYPCKTCGSKFPSYYFVHKHRKLCHAGEDNEVPTTSPTPATTPTPALDRATAPTSPTVPVSSSPRPES